MYCPFLFSGAQHQWSPSLVPRLCVCSCMHVCMHVFVCAWMCVWCGVCVYMYILRERPTWRTGIAQSLPRAHNVLTWHFQMQICQKSINHGVPTQIRTDFLFVLSCHVYVQKIYAIFFSPNIFPGGNFMHSAIESSMVFKIKKWDCLFSLKVLLHFQTHWSDIRIIQQTGEASAG